MKVTRKAQAKALQINFKMPKKILAVIPARGGSRGLPHKNIKLLNGKPLIAYTIESALQCALITDIVVSTDDPIIQEIALNVGAKVPFLRPDELASDTALAVPTIQHALKEMEALEGETYDYVIMLQPTSPLKTSEDLTKALEQLIKDEQADGIISVVDVDNWHPMKMKKFENNCLVDYQKPPTENPPRQLLPPVFMVNGALYATKRDVLMNDNSFQGKKCLGYKMPFERSVNIDTEIDFMAAEFFIKENL